MQRTFLQRMSLALAAAVLSIGFFASSVEAQRREAGDGVFGPLGAAEVAAKRSVISSVTRDEALSGRRPNIVLLFADDLGYGDIGCYGSTTIPTPHIDALAAQGTRFSQCYVTAGTCSPSRAGLMTGRYQERFGFEFNTGPARITEDDGRGLDPSAVTIADVLKQVGYATGVVGKWHLGTRGHFRPKARGFDEFFGFLPGAHTYLPLTSEVRDYATLMRGDERIAESEYLTDAFAREAVSFIDRHHEHPFFLYVPFNAVHTPLEATEKYRARFPGVTNQDQLNYNAMVSSLDDAVGTVVSAIARHQLADDTIVIFFDDNGGPTYTGVQSNGPLRLGKLFLFEGGIRVPMIVRWPGMVDENATHEGVVSSLDLFPTLAAAAGAKLPESLSLDGTDLLPYLQGKKAGPMHEYLCWRNGPNKAIRKGDWKLVRAGDHVWLFDLSKDLGETKNVAAEHPGVLRDLEGSLKRWEAGIPSPAWPSRPGQTVDVDGVPYEIHI